MTLELAVFDIETTGLFTGRHDRIVEIAMIRMTEKGEILDEFVSLVNPERDIGPTSIHGLESSDIASAPTFRDLAGELCERFDGTTLLAGHNVRFDQRFLLSEFERCEIKAPDFSVMCTMSLCGGGKLVDCCADFGIEFDGQQHSALDDSRATAMLLRHLLVTGTSDVDIYIDRPAPPDLRGLLPICWPKVPKGNRPPLTRQHAQARVHNNSYLERIIELRTSAPCHSSDEMAYSALLERVLEDRRIEDTESALLIETALDWGLSREAVARIHEDFLKRLVIAALLDGVVTEVESRDLQTVARLLGLDQTLLKSQVELATQRLGAATRAVAPANDLRGKSVCFTGELRSRVNGDIMTREQAHFFAAAAGLVISTSVTKSLNILVVADPETQSGKAKKARDYGTRILAENVFWNSIGVSTT
ncbi:MAG: polymerase epsilon subunit [Planctomycetaceae bacterium]|nr:polymerase epsilon subunit [Planctomycetaceae bacterium]